ncbi:autotransporter domain-containing protein [Mesorhizobium retamae]|uniref:Autotransporter domain-containing protein n=1 Tax=Mesorhizobium retamae TaxID=2912854 RepID=A0ABS9QH64_9HYPH|nr:autotransporter domain-containing protein [Mesorhizobium sp. IRAMC:0171]MCG7506799.1 autotransporter domain-containing protein [Mesorhizobium sp. IRAMC:0171]
MTLFSQARAQTVWLGSNSPNWFEGGNWSTGVVPAATDNVMIDLSNPGARIAGATALAGTVHVGGTGLLEIGSGGLLASGSGRIGGTPGSSGTIDVSGGSTWTVSAVDDIEIGVSGTGTLFITGGSKVGGGLIGRVAKDVDSKGAVLVSGAGSLWDMDLIAVGDEGTGTMVVADGGKVTSEFASIGDSGAGKGYTVVRGAGSTWTNVGPDTSLYVGYQAEGTLIVSEGGALISGGDVAIGNAVSAIGTANVTGAGSTWTLAATDELEIGASGNGSLFVVDGGKVSGGFLGRIAKHAGSTGTVLVSGTGSLWDTDLIAVGDEGTGTMSIWNGGTVNSEFASIGDSGAGEGLVTVRGATSTWTNIGTGISLYVGYEADGAMVIADGGTIISGGDAVIGNAAGATGKALVSGAGSRWTLAAIDELEIGTSGSGSLIVADGGKVEGGFLGRIARNAGSVGSVLVSGAGSLWDMDVIAVGDEGTGTMTVEDGGKVNSKFASIGDSGAGEGLVTVRGAGSIWTNVDAGISLYVGYEANGTLAVGDGGALVTGGNVVIGNAASAVGKVSVIGTGSTWMMAAVDDLDIGTSGTGSLVVGDGGKVAGGSIGRIARNAGSTGSLLVSGSGSLWDMDLIAIGDEGTGAMIVENGGTVVSEFASIGDSGRGKGLAIVRGAGSTWSNSDETGPIYVGYEADGTLMLADGGRFVAADGAGAIEVAVRASARGAVDIGGTLGEAAVAPGILDVRTVVFGVGTGTLNFNHTATDYVFAPTLIGHGNVNVFSGTTVLTGESNGFLGTTSVNGAKLVVNGQLGGTLAVHTNGWLAGSGTVGTTTLEPGATIAPGNSIGTLSVAGDISFAAGSTYQLEAGAHGRSDLIEASGEAILSGGTVAVVPLAGFSRDFRYKILSAKGGVFGTFDRPGPVKSAFLTPLLSYDTNNVFLAINQTASLDSVGQTPNQVATARGLASLANGNPLLEALLQLDALGARAAFDLLSGDVHASAKSALLEDSLLVRESIVNRLRDGTIDAPATHAMGTNSAGTMLGGLAFWSRAVGSWGEIEGDGNAATLDRSTGGFLAGADAAVSDEWRLGILGGYSRTSFDADMRLSSGKSDNAHLGIYGGVVSGQVALRMGAAYSWHDIDTGRRTAFAGFDDRLLAGYHAGTAQVFGELGYQLQAGYLDLEPFANVAYVNLHTDAFSESNGSAALEGSSSTTDATLTTFGLRAERGFVFGEITATAHGLIGWRHAFGERSPNADFSFAGGDVFTVAGVPLARNAAVLEAGLDVVISPSAGLGLSYSGQFGDGVRDHGIRADFSVRF